MKEHIGMIGDIRAARATGLIEGMAKGFDMKGERRNKQDDEQKEGSQNCISTRSLGGVLLSPGWVDAAARPLGVCPAHRFRKGSSRQEVGGGRRQVGERRREARGEGGRRGKEEGRRKEGRKEGGSSALFKTSTQTRRVGKK